MRKVRDTRTAAANGLHITDRDVIEHPGEEIAGAATTPW
jgi:hypothetical protein